jgi:Mn2+/Fe2+ NRAMP family transporter
MVSKLKSLGPGLLYAGAAIGVSHLVQSTKAGAQYGYILIIAIVLAHLFKYPFFVLGPRYAERAEESLVSGYAKIGKWAVVLLLILSLSTMFTVQAAVTLVTSGLIQNMGVPLHPALLSFGLLTVCLAILRIGKFSILDNLMKVIMIVLSISTLAAFLLSFGMERETIPAAKTVFKLTNKNDITFLLAFVGWMPAPLDLAIWHSIWTLSSGMKKSKGDFDFKVGFYGTAILGVCFLVLGANTMYGTRTVLAASSSGFAAQLINAFTSCLGGWSYGLISIAAFTTMFSTTLTCFDAMPRVMQHISQELNLGNVLKSSLLWQIILYLGTMLILTYAVNSMSQMVNFATIMSFITAPALALLSYQLVKQSPYELWSKGEKRLAVGGIVFLILFSIIYLLHFL